MPTKRREKQVEERLRQRALEYGGMAEKFTAPGKRSVPDRILTVPGLQWLANVVFVECKAPGEEPTEAQDRDHEKRRALGSVVLVVDDYDVVDALFEVLCDGSYKK